MSALIEYEDDPINDEIFINLFRVHRIVTDAMNALQKTGKDNETFNLFSRFWQNNSKTSHNYRAYLTILILCECVKKNIYSNEKSITYMDIK